MGHAVCTLNRDVSFYRDGNAQVEAVRDVPTGNNEC
jgi:hypothetical protein